jgi:hypothetical protein
MAKDILTEEIKSNLFLSTNNEGFTALHWAILIGKPNVLQNNMGYG